MWSEHCSYKNSRKELKKFPTSGSNILVKAGEESAGVVDIGDGWAIAFKIESHNHPSAIEPFQGAATGVGGIIRDIFTMGARPEFCLNSLRFGPITDGGTRAVVSQNSKAPTARRPPEDQKRQILANRRLFTGVVSGIAHYGNCIGIPTIGGEIYFDESFEGNPLVNVFCLGVLRHDQLARAAARGVGNPVFYVGAETGRDGLAGAAFASRELTEQAKEDRPAVQVGDPFKEKLLLEACLELLARDAVAGIQDMGAAGLTCSTCETASRGGSGIEIDLAKVPKREPGMTPYEILLSESQERMLIIAKRGEEKLVREIFDKWDVPWAEIGRVTDDGMMRVRNNGSVAAEIPAKPLADEAPLYSREAKRPSSVAAVYDRRTSDLPKIDNHESLRQLLRDPTIASKNWVYRQYDHTVRTGTMVKPGSDAAVFEPTPTIGMVGLVEKEEHITTQWFKKAGDVIMLVGKIGDELGGSRFLKVCHGKKIGPPPHVDLAHEITIQNAVRDLIREGLVQSAHDCSEGGLAVALAESCFNPKQRFGADVQLSAAETTPVRLGPATTALFNESQSRIIISVRPENIEKAMSILSATADSSDGEGERKIPFQKLGKVGGDQ